MINQIRAFFTRQCTAFTYLNITQFLGALNDNIFKLLIVYFLINLQGIQHSEMILATAGAIFVIPFLLFSSTSGTLADRWSKRNIIVSAKFLELLIMALGIWAFQLESPIGAYVILFLMATQSAYFGPSKYGIVPELVTSERISRANGLLTMFTFLAIIIGTFLASFITDVTGRNFIVGAVFCTLVAFAGFVTSLYISYTPPAGSTKKLNAVVPLVIYKTLKTASQHHCLLTSVFGSSFMMFIGAFFQLNIIPFAIQCLGLTDVQGGYLFLLTAVGIGCGSVVAGKLSGRFVELGLVPIAGTGIIAGYFMLDYYSDSLAMVIVSTLMVGMFGGVFVIPFDTFIQVASPKKHRGQIVAATNVLGFLGVLFASGMLYFISSVLGLGTDKGFTFVGITTIIVLSIITISIIDYFVRFLAMLASRVIFKITLDGHEKVPTTSASILVANYSSWYDSVLIMGSQRRAIHMYLEGPDPYPARNKIASLLRILPTSIDKPIEEHRDLIEDIKQFARRGISSCIFVEESEASPRRMEEMQRALESLFDDEDTPVFGVHIVKSERQRLSWLSRLFHKLREPASVTFHHKPHAPVTSHPTPPQPIELTDEPSEA